MNAYGTFLNDQPLVINIAYSPHPPQEEFEMRLQLQGGGIPPLEAGIPPFEEEDFKFVVTVPSASGGSLLSLGRRCPNVHAKLLAVLRHSACCCHRTKRICDFFIPSLSWLLFLATVPCIIVFSPAIQDKILFHCLFAHSYFLLKCLSLLCFYATTFATSIKPLQISILRKCCPSISKRRAFCHNSLRKIKMPQS